MEAGMPDGLKATFDALAELCESLKASPAQAADLFRLASEMYVLGLSENSRRS